MTDVPISIDEFENELGDGLLAGFHPVDGTRPDFPSYPPEVADTRREVHGSIDASSSELASIRSRLERDGPVRHESLPSLITERNGATVAIARPPGSRSSRRRAVAERQVKRAGGTDSAETSPGHTIKP